MNPAAILFESQKVHLLIDPDHWNTDDLSHTLQDKPSCIGSIIVGGTYVHEAKAAAIAEMCRGNGVPIGSLLSIGRPEVLLLPDADFVIIPILLGSRSSAFLCDHVINAVPFLERFNLKAAAIAYLPIDGGVATSAQFFTQHHPIPRYKPEIIHTLAAAAKYLGLSGVYLDAGSGATQPVSEEEVVVAKMASRLPIIVGGGIRGSETISALFSSGASGVVVGSILEQKRNFSWLSAAKEVTT
jgi:putative glycerol-1-phosphate prenyltransferase